jgi:hypothetical protein
MSETARPLDIPSGCACPEVSQSPRWQYASPRCRPLDLRFAPPTKTTKAITGATRTSFIP